MSTRKPRTKEERRAYDAARNAKQPPTMNTVQQYEYQVAQLRNQLAEQQRVTLNNAARFDKMFRASEEMRNRQVDIINRLMKGEPIPEQLHALLKEVSGLKVDLDSVSSQLAIRTAELEDAKSTIHQLRLSLDPTGRMNIG